MPGDAVERLALQERPGRRVEAGVPGEEGVVVVHGHPAGKGEYLRRQDPEIVDAEEEVEGKAAGQIGDVVPAQRPFRRLEAAADPPLGGPARHPAVPRHQAEDAVATTEEDLRATESDRGVAHHDAGERLHGMRPTGPARAPGRNRTRSPVGKKLSQLLGYSPSLRLRAEDFGELTVSAVSSFSSGSSSTCCTSR